MLIHICNNDNHGNWSDQISMVEFFIDDDETAMRIETKTMFPVKAEVFDLQNMQLRIHGCTVKFTVVGTWTGNMMWNTIEMLDYYALGFLRALQLSKEWDCTEAFSNLFEKFNAGELITGADFELSEDVQPRVVHPNQSEIPY